MQFGLTLVTLSALDSTFRSWLTDILDKKKQLVRYNQSNKMYEKLNQFK